MADSTDLALHYFGRAFSFSELADIVNRVAAGLTKSGIGNGDRIVVQLQNTPAFIFVTLAAWKLGAVIVPVSPMYSAREVRFIISDSQAVAFVTAHSTWAKQGADSIVDTGVNTVITTGIADFGSITPAVFDTVSDAPTDANTTTMQALVDDAVAADLPQVAVGPDDVAVLAYTSGTTGKPKGALITHGNLAWAGAAYGQTLGVANRGDVLLAMAPLVHITGLALHIGAWLARGSTLVLGYRFEPNYYLDLLATHEVTWTTGVSTAYRAMLEAMRARPRQFPKLRVLGCGGAPIPAQLLADVRQGFGVALSPGYGLTESTSAVTSTPGETLPLVDDDTGITSVGLAMVGAQIVVADETGTPVPAGVQGEIYVRSPGTMSGYWQNPDATTAAFRDDWLLTGDVGYLNEQGWLFIVDRTKNVIIASGYKVWPREVEEVLYAHPAVREAAVVGVSDHYRGETVKAYVSIRAGASVSAEDLITYCSNNLAAYKTPREIEFLDELPKNQNGKILHRQLRQPTHTPAGAD